MFQAHAVPAGHARPARAPGALEARVDGTRILLSPTTFAYFALRGAGEPLWDLIDGQRSVAQIVAELEGGFQAPPGVIHDESLDFLAALVAAGLVTMVADHPGAGPESAASA